jgi:hypothetical protein
MVTAILVPIILFYFYYLTKKDAKTFDEKWTALSNVTEEAILTGKIVNIKEEKQRFYYTRYVYILEISLQTSVHTVTAKKITPGNTPPQHHNLNKGQIITLYGNWEKEEFQISRIISRKN